MLDIALLLAAAAAAHFDPPLGTPLVYVSRESRVIGGKTMRFESHRRITFTRERDGFVATIAFDEANNDADGDVAAMFETAMASLSGRAVRLRLDPQGAVVAVENADAVWTTLCDAIAALPGDPGQRTRAADFAAALRTLPPKQRQKMLGSLVAPLVAGADAALAPGPAAPVTIHARPPAAPGAMLTGTQTVTRGADGKLDIHVSASGDVGAANGATAHVTADRERVIDPATGLVLTVRDHRVTTIGGDRTTADTHVRLIVPVS
jgi:hypothetical protein